MRITRSTGFIGAGWQFVKLIEPAELKNRTRRCASCKEVLTFGHALWNPHLDEQALCCASCATTASVNYDARAAEKTAREYLAREAVFLSPECWTPVRGRKSSTQRWLVIGGMLWRVEVARESAGVYRASLECVRDSAAAKAQESGSTQDIGKRLAFRAVNRLRSVMRDTGFGSESGEELDGEVIGPDTHIPSMRSATKHEVKTGETD